MACLSRDTDTSFTIPGSLLQLTHFLLPHFNQSIASNSTKMGLRAESESTSPTAEELISQLRSSFYSHEFDYVAKTLTDRENLMKQKFLNLKTKAKEEIDLLVSNNLKLTDELKKKQNEIDAVHLKLKTKDEARVCENQRLKDELKKKQEEIDAMMKQIADYEMKFRALGFGEKVLSSEKVAKESMGSSVNLENKEQKNCAAEIYRKPPLFNEKKDSKIKTEAKLCEVINIDDDDDDDDDQGKRASNKIKRDYSKEDDDGEFISSIKRSRVSNEIKIEHLDKSKNSPVLEKVELDGSEPDSGSDNDEVQKLYACSIVKLTKQKQGWESESDMVKDFEKDEICLNGVCALHRQRINVDKSDAIRLNSLARKLIDGDSQKKLKKKASELNRLDLDHCRVFAKRYSSQLFNIYLNKSDPFFPTSRSQE